MPSDRPDPSEFLAMAQRMLRELFGDTHSGDDEPWAEATRSARESRAGEVGRRDREPSAEQQRENLTFALATRAVEALEDLALNVAAIRQRLERTSTTTDGPRADEDDATGRVTTRSERGRARAQEMFDVSAAIVVSSPCPVRTTVSPGSVSSRVRIDSRIVGLSLSERPVAPGPPQNSVSPVNTVPRSGAWRQVLPGEWPGVCSAVSVVPATSNVVPSASVLVRCGVRVDDVPEHPVLGVEPDRGAGRLPQGDRGGDVVVVPVGEHDRRARAGRRSPRRSGRRRAGRRSTSTSSSSPTSQTLLSTSKSWPSRLKTPLTTALSMRARSFRTPRPSAGPRPCASSRTPPRRRRARSSRRRRRRGRSGPAGTGRSASGSRGWAGSRRTRRT